MRRAASNCFLPEAVKVGILQCRSLLACKLCLGRSILQPVLAPVFCGLALAYRLFRRGSLLPGAQHRQGYFIALLCLMLQKSAPGRKRQLAPDVFPFRQHGQPGFSQGFSFVLAGQGQEVTPIALGNVHTLYLLALGFPLQADGCQGGGFLLLDCLQLFFAGFNGLLKRANSCPRSGERCRGSAR
jgi:hypothetical protein